MRAARAAIVIPCLFALTSKVIGDSQMALMATFGGFATLVIANFEGNRRDKFFAHTGLTVAGGLVLIIGTLVTGSTWLATIVTIPVAFLVLFAGVAGPNFAIGGTAVLFAYVLPAMTAGGPAVIASRLEGWLLASAAGTLAVLLLSPPAAGDRLRSAAATLAEEIAGRVRAASDAQATSPDAMRAAAKRLRAAFTAAPYRPTGLASTGQALSSVVQLLDWAATQTEDALDGHLDAKHVCPADRTLLRVASGVFSDVGALMSGREADPDLTGLEAAREQSATNLRDLDDDFDPQATSFAVHAQAIAVAARTAATAALIATRKSTAEGATRWGVDILRGGASIRSVWFANSMRGALALAAAVLVADLSGVQHGFWVVLGTLSVLRTSAAATGANAWRALAGTTVGFAVGALLLAAIGTGQTALWVAFPLAVLIAAYAPGTTPFIVGQAAFTITIVVLFNILVPAGWKVGLLRVEDVAIGCAVSLIVGIVCWPRGASGIVADDLADAFRAGAAYLRQAVDWALSELLTPPATAAAATAAGLRLEDGLRVFLSEQGSKRLAKEDLWALVAASGRLRLTAETLSDLRQAEFDGDGDPADPACAPLPGSAEYTDTPACVALRSAAAGLADFYARVADEVGRARDAANGGSAKGADGPGPVALKPPPALDGTQALHPHLLWVHEHLHHLHRSAETVGGPAMRVAMLRKHPWWR
jgi:uncharacterized membrane protein YccC